MFREAVLKCGGTVRCISATNGIEAFQAMDTILPDLIFLDNNIPVLNGRDTLIAIRKRPALRSVPVYMYGGEDSHRLLELGATACLLKPDSFRELCELVQQVMGNMQRNAS